MIAASMLLTQVQRVWAASEGFLSPEELDGHHYLESRLADAEYFASSALDDA